VYIKSYVSRKVKTSYNLDGASSLLAQQFRALIMGQHAPVSFTQFNSEQVTQSQLSVNNI
jgi:hypothetical protein